MRFALACEGITDHATLENVLCGFYGDEDLDLDIAKLQPAFDRTDMRQAGGGGWTALLKYLRNARFRDDVVNNKVLLIQIDTDVSEHKGFNVSHSDKDGNILSEKALVASVIKRLASIINEGEVGFFEKFSHKIVFCISVHSIESWILAAYLPAKGRSMQIDDGFDHLKSLLSDVHGKGLRKNYRTYRAVSQKFLNIDTIADTRRLSASFDQFIIDLQDIEPSPLVSSKGDSRIQQRDRITSKKTTFEI